MDRSIYLPLVEHDDDREVKNYRRPNGIYVSLSKRHECAYLTIVDISPIDSWGANWEQFQQCAVIKYDEIDQLISILQSIKDETS